MLLRAALCAGTDRGDLGWGHYQVLQCPWCGEGSGLGVLGTLLGGYTAGGRGVG